MTPPPITAADIAAQAAMFLDVLDQAREGGEDRAKALWLTGGALALWQSRTFVFYLERLAATATVEHIAPEDAG